MTFLVFWTQHWKMTNTTEEWQHGTIRHVPIWVFYSFVNYLGSVLCAILVWTILCSKRRSTDVGTRLHAADVFVIGLCLGCLAMSIPCATQCAINLAGGTEAFQYGQEACVIEAFAHVSAIML